MPKIVDATERRREITEAAARLIARSGLDSVTMRDVAAEAGWTTGVVTHYFADKRELLRETYLASLAVRQSKRLAESAGARERLRSSLEGALPLDEDRRLHWMVTLVCITQSSDDPELARARNAAYGEFRRFIADLVTEAGHRGPRSADEVAAELIAAADGIAVQALLGPDRWPPARQRATLSTMLSGLSAGWPGLEL